MYFSTKFQSFRKGAIEQSIASRFEEQVAKSPAHPAIRSGDFNLSYQGLNRLANKIARAIYAQQITQENPIVIFLEQGAIFIATFLGILKIGRCSVPIDPYFPKSRNIDIIADSKTNLIITNENYLNTVKDLAPENCKILNLDTLDSSLPDDNLELSVSPDSAAYILYTSGSTGKPKGVFQNHRNFLHFIRQQINSLRISPSDRVTMLYSCSVNGALRGTFYTLLNGATLYPFNVKQEGLTNLINWLIEEKITIYHSVTTLYRHMTSVLTEANPFPHVRMVILGGEAVSAADVALYKKLFSPECLFYTGLGATETGTIREYIVNKQTTVAGGRMPLGYGVEDRDIMLWDESGKDVAPGQVGEICVRSPYLALGYWQNPEKTHQVFLPDPDGGDRRIYRTGDLGKFLPDGCLVHQGRKDFQVKIRGYRVELSEIELALVRHDSVKEAVVVGRQDSLGTQRLIAYVVPVSMPDRFSYQQDCQLKLQGQALTLTTEDIAPDSVGIIGITTACQAGDEVSLELVLPGQERPITLPGKITQLQDPRARIQFENLAEGDLEVIARGIDYLCEQEGRFRFSASTLVGNLRSQVKLLLPDYMVPSAFVLVESLPLTANGKVNRKALPDPPTDPTSIVEQVPPTTLTQKALASIWQQVLGRSQISIEDNFFELGGHSLLAAQIVARIQTICQVALPLSALFETPTIQELADSIDQRIAPSDSTLPPITVRQASATAPVSFAQQRLWFLQQLEPESSAYHITRAFALQGPLQVEALQQALATLLARHESLRTNFVVVDGVPQQSVASIRRVDLPVTDLSKESAAQQEETLALILEQGLSRPFDLAADQLLRATLIRRGEEAHILQIVMHHIASDGWSMTVFRRELSALYAAYASGQPHPLPELPIQYADFAQWQRQWLAGEVLNAQLGYWKQQLQGAPPLLDLPTDYPRPAQPSYRGGWLTFNLSPSLTDHLQRLGQQNGATLFMTLLTAFNMLLYRYTQQADIVVGSPIANRNHPELEGLIGFFANTLILRTDLSGRPSFQALLKRVRQVALAAYAHQNLPFEKLVEELQPERNLSYSPLFQVFFVLQSPLQSAQPLGGLSIQSVPIHNETAKFDLTLSMREAESGLSGIFKYNTDLFKADTIERMVGHFQTLLAEIVTHPDEAIDTLSIMSTTEHNQLLAWNSTQTDYPQEQCIHQLFEAQVERTPNAIALTYQNQHLTYRELNSRANQLARHLQSKGVTTETLVGLYVERSLNMIVGLLGILKAGGAYVPLDPNYPQQRLCQIREDAQLNLLVTQQSLATDWATPITIALDKDWPTISQESEQNLEPQGTSEHLAYVIYTSGSTGKPKGVMIQHRSVSNLATALQQAIDVYGQEQRLTVSMNGSLAFDTSVKQIVQLFYGHRLDIMPEATRTDGAVLLTHLQTHDIDLFDCTPSQLNLLLSAGLLESKRSLTLLLGGEPINEATWKVLRKAKNIDTYNLYGPTECTVDATICPLKQVTDHPTIGRPLLNVQTYILDPQLSLLPAGIPGELYIGGTGLARGYLNQPQLTTEKFIPNPFGAGRLYKTSDLGKYHPDGTIEYLGRMDHQIKLRGFRIELEEIETILVQHTAVQQAVVIMREDRPGNQHLVAYMVAVPEQMLVVSELRHALKQALPHYMVPTHFVLLETLPLTANGKVDLQALPAPEQNNISTTIVAPRTPIEETLARIWSTVLEQPLVSIYDNFFELGGHSLLAAQVMSRIRQQLGWALPLRNLFEYPTVAELAQWIEQSDNGPGGNFTQNDLPPIVRRQAAGPAPLSFAQQRLWFLQQLEPSSSRYHITWALQLYGPLQVEALQRALTTILERHETLRTCFVTNEGIPQPVIARVENFELQITDLRDSNKQEETLKVLLKQASQQPFNLISDPMMRAALICLGEETHLLQIVMHHIATDGWSMDVFRKELGLLYEAYSKGEPNPLPELSIHYSDFAHWQRQWLAGEVLENQLSYWKQQLSGAPPLLELPTDFPRPTQPSYQGARVAFTIPRSVTQALKALSQKTNATLFMTLLAAFNTLLYRYTQQTDIVIGSPIANRNHAELEHLVGFFANTLALRTDLSDNPNFYELLKRVRKVSLDAYAHQSLPFEKLIEELQPERSLSYSPIFQVLFVLQNAPQSAFNLENLSMQTRPVGNTTAKFDLTLSIREQEEALGGVIEYSLDLFEAETIQRLIGHFQTLLSGIINNPTQKVASLPLVSVPERQQLVLTGPHTQKNYPLHLCIHQLVEAQAERTPDRIAVTFECQQLTYAELNTRANQLARYLQTFHIGPESLVGIALDRSLDMLVGLLGILKAGGAYVPLDPSYPQERLDYMVDHSGLTVLVTQPAYAARFAAHAIQVIDIERDLTAMRSCHATNPVSGVTDANLAYVIYTSGSTGKPKGVQIEHQAVVNFLYSTAQQPGLTAQDRLLAVTTISFDIAVLELYLPLTRGAQIVLASRAVAVNGMALSALMTQSEATVMQATPATWQLLLSTGWQGQPGLKMLCGGEALSRDLANALLQRGQELWNLYGPTEATVWAAAHRVLPGNTAVPLSGPLTNTQLYVLSTADETGTVHFAPMGVPGELYIGGIGLARGYLNQPELTQTRFIPNPFSGEPHARLYKTGDLARLKPNSTLEFLGRIDHQVKLRGYRIELGEIASALGRHPTIRQCAVLVREDNIGSKQLIAYMLLSQDESEQPEQLIQEYRAFLRQALPDYMIPSLFVTLESLPLTPNGKMDRKALQQLEINHAVPAVEGVAPRTALEAALAVIWGEVLKLDDIGIHNNFFELGGHSLLAAQVMSRMRQQLSLELPLRHLFEYPTIAELAQWIEHEGREVAGTLPPIVRRPESGPAPLSFAQQRLWFLQQLEPGDSRYHITWAMQLHGPLNLQALHQALKTILERHDTLRTAFIANEGIPQQVITNADRFELSITDLSQAEQPEAVLTTLLKDTSQQSFNLATDLMMRAALFRLGDEAHVLQIVMHHIATDGWSMDIFGQELSLLYQAYVTENPNPLPQLPIQYGDFAHWQRQWLCGDVLEKEIAYWKQQLSDAPSQLELPTDFPRPAQPSYQGARVAFTIPRSVTQALKALSQKTNATLFMTLLAAFNTLLYRYTQQTDIVVGSPIANRNHAELENLIGFFANTLALRTDLSDNPNFYELLKRVRKVSLDAYAHQSLPFEKLVEELQPERSLSYSPIFQILFVLQNTPQSDYALSDLISMQPQSINNETAKFDLTLSMEERAEELSGVFKYSTDLFTTDTLQRMVNHLKTLLAAIVDNPDGPIATLPMLTEAEQQQLVEWNSTQVEYPQLQGIHQLFEAQVEKTPDRIALVYENQQLTYQQLNQRANQLSHHLHSLGVKPETLVGLCLERSLDMMVGLLGVLKAGGAYVPLDPMLPQDRLSFMLDNSGATVLVTQQALQESLPDYKGQTVYLDSGWDEISQQSPINGVRRASGKNLAYVLYTSGSTGRPKGVAVEHRQLLNYIHGVITRLELSECSSFATVSTLAADLGNTVIFPALSTGGTLHIISQERITHPNALADYFCQHPIDCLKIVPSHLTAMLMATNPEQVLPHQRLVLGGEACSWQLVEKVRRLAPNCVIFNHYGPTETTVGVAACKLGNTSADSPKPPIGRPLANSQIYLLDPHRQLVPNGTPGEVYIGGAGLARGYFKHPSLTAQTFIPHPFDETPGARLYKTGDLGRYRADGTVELLGRIDHQVKIRGNRIELGEVEVSLNQHPLVQQCVVLTREDRTAGMRLVAYVASKDQVSVDHSQHEYRSFLQKSLPEYMIPSRFVMMESLPLTPNGKINRKALTQIEVGAATPTTTRIAPRTDLEVEIATIWCEVLQLEDIGVQDNFFDVGGHSLLAIHLTAQLQIQLSCHLPLSALFQAPTIEQLAALIHQETASASPFTSLVTLQAGTAPRQPLFFVHPVGGSVHCYQEMARCLGPEQPFNALQSRALDGRHSPHTNITDMARAYLDEILSVQPEGPYVLGGWSMGGIVAFEIAQQLRSQGQQINSLALIDSHQPNPKKLGKNDDELLLRFAKYLALAETKNLTTLTRLTIFKHQIQSLPFDQKIERLLEWLISMSILATDIGLSQLRQIFLVFKHNFLAVHSYKPKAFSGTIALFTCQEPVDQRSNKQSAQVAYWNSLAIGGLVVEELPANHFTVLQEPSVSIVVNHLRQAQCELPSISESPLKSFSSDSLYLEEDD